MGKRARELIVGISALLLLMAGCAEEEDDNGSSSASTVTTATTTKSGSGSYNHVDYEATSTATVDSVLQYTHELGSTPQDVYFIFTNTTESNVNIATTVRTQNQVEVDGRLQASSSWMEVGAEASVSIREYPIGIMGTPAVSASNARSPSENGAIMGPQMLRSSVGPSLAVAEGDSHVFMNDSTTDTVSAKARKVRTVDSMTLTIWVEDKSWDTGCVKAKCMTQAMVDAFADKFLQIGSSNDIYDWISSVYGAPWGSHAFTNLIPAASKDAVDILFFDIDGDGDPGDNPSTVTLGFFWNKDNFAKTSNTGGYSDASNERLLFYMDSVLAATEDSGSSWAISHSWPGQIVSTLAHEFQHMVHFYQKNTVHNISSETWVNEMASMVAEDLLADKIAADGPRGVTYSDYTAGIAGNENGRPPWFNVYDYYPVATWTNSLAHYGNKYAFGAYLARNYGGAGLFQKIVQRGYSDHQAVTNALTAMGYRETLTSLLQKWGVAVLLSSDTGMSNGSIYNNGNLLSSELNSITYNLGSINLFNYKYGNLTGPYLFTPSTLATFGGHYATSNTYVLVGQGKTGSFTATVNMEPGVRLTVVTKNSN